MSEQNATITIETEQPEQIPEPQSIERTIGQLETETEHLAEQVTEAEQTAEQAEQTAETAIEIASEASERSWNAREAIEELRNEIPGMIQAELLRLQSEDEDGQDESIEEIELPEESDLEPVPEVKTRRVPGWLI